MAIKNRILRLTLIILLSVTVVLVVSVGILSYYAQDKAESILKSLEVKTSSIQVNLFTRSITISDLEWTYSTDSLLEAPHHFQAKDIQVKGVSLYQLLRHKKLHINDLFVDDGVIFYNNKLQRDVQKSPKKESKLNSISIGVVRLKNITTNISYDTLPEYAGVISLTFHDLALTDINKASDLSRYQLNSIEGNITGIRLHEKESMYNTSIARLYINSDKHQVTIDSVYLIPIYSKHDFSRKLGKQVDRFSASFPKISITGLIFNKLRDSLFTASVVHIASAELHVYRDKRLPFIKKEDTPLPMALIRSLSFGAAIDTVRITNAKITYEEFPEKGFETGHVTFERLNATLDHISNRGDYSNYKQSTLIVSAKIMEEGVINAEFSLPYGEPQIYNAKGNIKNLELNRLNPILENLAFISITSGMLNQLTFSFDYNDLVSRGSLLINYDNLKIVSMTKEKESIKNEFKTWILNTALKKDKDKSVDKAKRSGTIYFERNRKKAVFNVWVQSLFSGLKSSVLDSSLKKEREK